MSLFYDLAYLVFGLFYFPIFLIKGKQAASFRELVFERLCLFPGSWNRRFLGKKVLWIHAVSVGEVRAVEGLIPRLLEQASGHDLVLTTVTPTGQRVAKRLESRRVTVCYCPFDISFMVRGFLRMLRPDALLLVETEIWPNLVSETAKMNIPVGILNGRLSQRSMRGYTGMPWIFRKLFGHLGFVLAQTGEDAERFLRAGARQGTVHVAGNLKLDDEGFSRPPRLDRDALRQSWGIGAAEKMIMAGSTHPGEEEMLLVALTRVRERTPDARLLIAPRHIERAPALKKIIEARGFTACLASESKSAVADVRLLDQMGLLRNLYGMADIIFMGGSLVRHGGQSPIEPAVFQRAIVHGPHVFNFAALYQYLDDEGGAVVVRDEEELAYTFERLLGSEKERSVLGEHAFKTLSNLRGATQAHLKQLFHYLGIQTSLESVGHV